MSRYKYFLPLQWLVSVKRNVSCDCSDSSAAPAACRGGELPRDTPPCSGLTWLSQAGGTGEGRGGEGRGGEGRGGEGRGEGHRSNVLSEIYQLE